jgi:hypothetical protein
MICLEALENRVNELPCGHCFHIGCLEKMECRIKLGWCACVCPLCRESIGLKSVERDEDSFVDIE